MKYCTISGGPAALRARKESLRDDLGRVLYTMTEANPEMAELQKVAAAEMDPVAIDLGVKQPGDLAALQKTPPSEVPFRPRATPRVSRPCPTRCRSGRTLALVDAVSCFGSLGA